MLDLFQLEGPARARRIVVAMSGGVDSSVVAGLAARTGAETIGVTLQLYDHGSAVKRAGSCCAGQDIRDARAVADRLGIAHYVFDHESRFRETVIDQFADEYVRGRTPIPCVRCNMGVKFTDLFRLARELGADCLATGHYVRRILGEGGPELHRAIDPARDQSYFLFATTNEQLDYLRFPLGGMPKSDVREIAREMGLVVAMKPDSQDICFVPNGDYASVVRKIRPEAEASGDIVDESGKVLGRHKGLIHYTVGQRRGLELGGLADPVYVIRLDPALQQVGAMFGAKQALFAHAVASPYRDRSHFDGQNVLETGGTLPYDRKDGWLNRLLALLPGVRGLAISPTIPAAMRGPVQVASYAPSNLPDANDDLLRRVEAMYAADAQLHALWAEALQTRAMAGDAALDKAKGAEAAGKMVASLMTGPEAARVVMIETTGWDTHAGQNGRLAAQLGGLDAMLGALRDNLGAAWNDTMVVVATEFGRTAAANGTGGTDHGTASLAMLLGGTVAGGRILADWPGLAPPQLYEGRDLKPTTSLDALIGSAVTRHFGLDPDRALGQLFPGTEKALPGLIRV